MPRQIAAVEMPPPTTHRVLAGELDQDAGYHIRRSRGTDDWLLMHTVAGAGLLHGADDQQLTTSPGDAVLVRPGTLHDYGTDPATGRWHLLFSHFRPLPTWLALLDWPEPVVGIGRVRLGAEVDDRVQQLLLAAARASRMAVGRPELFALNGVEAALLWYDTRNPRQQQLDERVLRVMEHVDAHLAEDLDVPALARIAHLSPSRLAHLFSAQVGTSVMRYLEAQRMELAARLLEMTGEPVAEVARRVGYLDPLYFSRRFRARHHVSPTAHREQHR
ncbi:helix-turn-helix domain-containing protein [Brachybacterium sp. FME24]|uniref:helix-turn-helix domain-containing protein n=1 Tax=Brachybacterium sp. FME24 TaxID=2742605 RepID=UPI00186638A6|nr:helix-turn-helix domain-containing protein [Brachybacterium sp. FME24]